MQSARPRVTIAVMDEGQKMGVATYPWLEAAGEKKPLRPVGRPGKTGFSETPAAEDSRVARLKIQLGRSGELVLY